MKKLFGTDGIRGSAGEFPLDRQTINIIGESFARHLFEKLGRPPRLISGRDTRESGSWMEKAFFNGALKINAECESAGIITTPGVAYLTKKFDFDAGIVISASHNPFSDNGIKIFLPSGKKTDEEIERAVETDVSDFYQNSAETFENSENHDEFQNNEKRIAEFHKAYLDYLIEEFKDLSLAGFKMIVDCANGAACEFAPLLFANFGAEVVAVNNSPDGKNINENCGSTHIEQFPAKVLAENADFGVAFDGDADRALFIDEKGNLVDGDATLWIMARYFKGADKLKNNLVVATVMSNLGLEIAFDSESIKLERAKVGDKYVLQKLLATDSVIGGEQSGHIIFTDKSLVGDGMLTTLYVLEAMREQNKSLSEIVAGFNRMPQILLNVKVREKIPFESNETIAAAAQSLERQLGAKGRLLLRYSGTENLARVMIEGENQSEIEEQARHLAQIIEKNLG